MFGLFKKKSSNELNLTETFQRIAQIYEVNSVTDERKEYLKNTVSKFGYLPYPYFKVLEELTEGEIIYTLMQILELEGTYKDSKFLKFDNPSPLSRNKIEDSNWFKKEAQNIKLISISALGDGNKDENASNFIEWLAQIIILPRGNKALNVLPDTIYLLPFHPREFGCAYLPMSSDVSKNIEDKKLLKFFGIKAKEQVKLFITLAQLAGHPVIYDILPQTARFSKTVLANPYVARWFSVDEIIKEYVQTLDGVIEELKNENKFSTEDIERTKEKYIEILRGSHDNYQGIEIEIAEEIEEMFIEIKKIISENITSKKSQEYLVKDIFGLIEDINGKKIKSEDDIQNQELIIKILIKEGYWPMPGGAWCSSGVPVFDKMNPDRTYPLFKHYNYKDEDVTNFANLDCQTPYYFTYFDNGNLNKKVVDFYVNYTEKLQKEYNFDGFRVDHVDHIVDRLSEKDGVPISYRIPRKVLGLVNSNLKKKVPYFATLAEYMLWDNYYSEYHKDMNFDLLWGSDIISQSSKTPSAIISDNKTLEDYNVKEGGNSPLSILKTYNNQDGEFEAIDQYPAQLGEQGALFKWFKLKFLTGGKYANRPALYVDGDESFTQKGIEYVIGHEVSMKRNNNWNFYEKFNAINYFAQNSEIITKGKAKLILEEENGFSCFEINSESGSLLVVCNFKNPTEKLEIKDENGNSRKDIVYGETIYNSKVTFKGRKLKSYYNFALDETQKCCLKEFGLGNYIENELVIGSLQPSEFKIFGFEN